MAKQRHSKHDRIIADLEKRLRASDRYALVLSNIEYRVNNHFGECDLFGIRRDCDAAFVFEVKTTNSSKARSKAYRQIDKDIDYIWEHYSPEKVFGFYVYGVKGAQFYEVQRVRTP